MTLSVLPGTTFCGYDMAQTWEDLQLYEKVLNDRPDLKCILELGTGQGGLSQFLYHQCRVRHMQFHTFDVLAADKIVPDWHLVDVLQDSVTVRGYFTHPLLLICDNGNKPLEVELYAPMLEVGDMLAVHDWGVEIHPKHIPDALFMAYENWSHSLTRFFDVVA